MNTLASLTSILRVAYLIASASLARATFDAASSENVAIYWGQNSHGSGSGSLAQQDLAYYCANTEIDILPLAFLTTVKSPALNFANSGNGCTTFPNSALLNCPQIASDIATCQGKYQKTLLLSIGGATYTEGGFSSPDEAVAAADNIWAMFGPPQSGNQVQRPFGNSVIDGFDFDFESVTQNMAPFAKRLRTLMDADKAQSGKSWMLTAAPQCPYPDIADNQMLGGGVSFDAIWVQFYNNYCGLTSFSQDASRQGFFNFDTWDHWAKTVSANPNVKIMVGIPGSATAAGTGYQPAAALAPVFSYCKQFSSFGGVMIWDVSQVYANDGFLDQVISGLGGPAATYSSIPSPPRAQDYMPSTASTLLPLQVSSPPPTQSLVGPNLPPASPAPTTLRTLVVQSPAQTAAHIPIAEQTVVPQEIHGNQAAVHHWNQCGGEDWRGGNVCEAPYECVVYSKWYSDCR